MEQIQLGIKEVSSIGTILYNFVYQISRYVAYHVHDVHSYGRENPF